jgi:primosomal protein N'
MADDWSSFYAHEITQRKLYLFPPFRFLLKVAVRRASAAAAERTANLLAAKLQETNLQITVDGPMPSFHEKVQGKYQWQLVIKAEHRQELLRVVQLLPAGWSFDLDPADLL